MDLQSTSSSFGLPGNAQIRSFMDKLSSSNLASYVELPMIAVMGDTSSGKSSLLSSVALVELPSSSELTTRCPIVLKMSRGDLRSAGVSIRWHDHGSDSNSYSQKVMNRTFAPKIISDDKWETLSSEISNAQRYIMSHCTGKDVSRDMVEVKVVGPDYEDLTLVDLPGIVRSHGKHESDTLRHEIDALIGDYLRNERCVILAVVPANVDFHNSQIMADAQKVDPETKRTIPVITKPDTIDPGAEKEVLDLLQGRKMEFRLGFHMTKGRGQQALNSNQTIEHALDDEEAFFSSKEPWRSMIDRSVFGIHKLRSKLGVLQVSMIRSSIPGIMKDVNKRREEAVKELGTLGEHLTTVTEKRQFLNRTVTIFTNNLDASLTGKRGCNRSITDCAASAKLHTYFKEFRKEMRKGTLSNINTIKENGNVLVAVENAGEIRGKVKILKEDFACVDFVDEKDKGNETMFQEVGVTEAAVTDSVSPQGKYYCIRGVEEGFEDGNVDIFEDIPLSKIRTDPSWLKLEIEKNRTEDLACFLNSDVFNTVVANFIEEEWKPLCFELLEKASNLVEKTITAALLATNIGSQHSKLCTLIELRSADHIKSANNLAKDEIAEHLLMEMHPYTQDHYLFETISRKRNRQLKTDLERCLLVNTDGAPMSQASIKAALEGTFNRNQCLSIDDHMAEEMEVMIEAYGNVCFKRVIDKTPMICQKMFRTVSQGIGEAMQGVTDAELDFVMQRESDVFRRYEAANATVCEMDKAIKIFRELQTGLINAA